MRIDGAFRSKYPTISVGNIENSGLFSCSNGFCLVTLWSQMIGVVKNTRITKRNMCCMMRIPQRMW
jgi:hypothetical protein